MTPKSSGIHGERWNFVVSLLFNMIYYSSTLFVISYFAVYFIVYLRCVLCMYACMYIYICIGAVSNTNFITRALFPRVDSVLVDMFVEVCRHGSSLLTFWCGLHVAGVDTYLQGLLIPCT